MERLKTHNENLDKILHGGFPQNSTILISGPPGTGKTILSLQTLFNNSSTKSNPCIYFTFEEKRESLIKQSKQFSFDLEDLEKKGKIKIISIGSKDISKTTIDEIIDIIKSKNSPLVIIDSITTLSYTLPLKNSVIENIKYTLKNFLYEFITQLKSIDDLTSIFISQKDEIDSDTISRYLCDVVINLDYNTFGGGASRFLSIKKMRCSSYIEDTFPIQIVDKKRI